MNLSETEIKAIASEVVRQLLSKLVSAPVRVSGPDEEFVSVRQRIDAAAWVKDELRRTREKRRKT